MIKPKVIKLVSKKGKQEIEIYDGGNFDVVFEYEVEGHTWATNATKLCARLVEQADKAGV